MDKIIIDRLVKDKMYDYLKENSHLIKELSRHPESYEEFKKFIKEKYHLRVSDKVSSIIDDIELVSDVMETIK